MFLKYANLYKNNETCKIMRKKCRYLESNILWKRICIKPDYALSEQIRKRLKFRASVVISIIDILKIRLRLNEIC